jgi:hypothetical protein
VHEQLGESGDRLLVSSVADSSLVTSATSWALRAAAVALCCPTRRAVTSRKYTDSPSGEGQARSSYQSSSGAG